MDIKKIIKSNNHKVLIDIKKLPIDERKELAEFFSEGSKTLGMALRTLWNKRLYTIACCKGHLFGERDWMFSRMYSYIAFDKDINVFQYLSDELLSNPYVAIGTFDYHQAIYFFGRNRDDYMLKFISDIMNKKVINSKYLSSKMNRPLDYETMKEVKREYYLDSGFTEDEIKKLNDIDMQYKILKMNKDYVYIPDEEYDKLFNESASIYDKLKMRKMSKKRRERK